MKHTQQTANNNTKNTNTTKPKHSLVKDPTEAFIPAWAVPLAPPPPPATAKPKKCPEKDASFELEMQEFHTSFSFHYTFGSKGHTKTVMIKLHRLVLPKSSQEFSGGKHFLVRQNCSDMMPKQKRKSCHHREGGEGKAWQIYDR